MKTLPKTVLISLKEKGTDNEYLYANVDIAYDLFEDGEKVGVYKLEKVFTLKVSHTLIPLKKK